MVSVPPPRPPEPPDESLERLPGSQGPEPAPRRRKVSPEAGERSRTVQAAVLAGVALILFFIIFAGIAANRRYVTHVIDANNRKWCSVLTLIVEGQKIHPPKTAEDKQFAAVLAQLSHRFGCS